jgi:hypothetical protein
MIKSFKVTPATYKRDDGTWGIKILLNYETGEQHALDYPDSRGSQKEAEARADQLIEILIEGLKGQGIFAKDSLEQA